jgi:hypothetical protein
MLILTTVTQLINFYTTPTVTTLTVSRMTVTTGEASKERQGYSLRAKRLDSEQGEQGYAAGLLAAPKRSGQQLRCAELQRAHHAQQH